jgi:hypothetical protein
LQCLQLLVLSSGAHHISSKTYRYELHLFLLMLGIDGSAATLLLLVAHAATLPAHLLAPTAGR